MSAEVRWRAAGGQGACPTGGPTTRETTMEGGKGRFEKLYARASLGYLRSFALACAWVCMGMHGYYANSGSEHALSDLSCPMPPARRPRTFVPASTTHSHCERRDGLT
jgi:hypothetical protein